MTELLLVLILLVSQSSSYSDMLMHLSCRSSCRGLILANADPLCNDTSDHIHMMNVINMPDDAGKLKGAALTLT